MDLNTCLICVSVFVVSAIILLLFSFFGMKEKTYEEAIAEQRQKGLGFHVTKSQTIVKITKEVKHKKLGKKTKEKVSENRSESHPSPTVEGNPLLEVTKVEAEDKTEPPSLGDQKEKKKKEKKLKASKEEVAPVEEEKREKKKEKKPKLVKVEEDAPQTEFLESVGEVVSPVISSKKSSSTDKHVHQEKPVQAGNSEQSTKTHTALSESAPSKTAETKGKVEEVIMNKAKNKMHTQNEIQNQTETPAPSKEKILTPAKEKTLTSSKEKTLTQSKEKTLTQSKEKTQTPAKEKTLTSKEKTLPPSKEKTLTSPKEKTLTQSKEKTLTQSKEKTLTQSKEKTVTQSKEKTLTQSKEKTLTQSKEKTLTPPKAKKVTPPKEETLMPSKEQTLMPSKEQTLTPSKEQILTPSKEQTLTPPKEKTLVPPKEVTLNMTAKERKKKKNELNSLLEADGTGDILSGKGLLPLLHKAVLTDGEIQNLIEALLNKQQQGGAGSEWLDASGRLDPVSALKKQLAEKEAALKEEQDSLQAYQVKLREMRTELNHSMHQRRTLEDKHQQEIQALHARLQHSHDQHVAEVQTVRSQLQVQSKMSEEHVRQVCQIQGEKNQLQQAMSQLEQQYSSSQMELETLRTTQDQYDTHHAAMQQAQNDLAAQVQQLEDHMRKQEQQKREDEEAHKNQICQLTSQLMESENARSALSTSIEKLQESQESAEYRNAVLQKKISMLETLSARVAELTSQLEEANKMKLEVDLRLKDMEAKTEKMTACLSEREREIMELHEENEALVVQITSATTRPAAEGQEENAEKQNSDILENEAESRNSSVDVKQYEMIIAEKDGTIEKLISEICEKDGAFDKISNEICDYKSELRNTRDELDSQRKKNNVLREKNWKAMEALSAAEKSLEIKMKESDKLVSEYCHNAVKKEQTLVRELLQRLFPAVCVKSCKEHNLWTERFEAEAHKYIQELTHTADSEQKATQCLEEEEEEDLTARLMESEEQISKLQAQVAHYKFVLNETEGILNKLQNSVEAEEKIWEQKLDGKEVELETIQREKESLIEKVQLVEEQNQSLQEQLQTMEESMEQLHAAEEMQEKLRELQEKLQGEEAEKRTLALKCDQANKNYIDLHKKLDTAKEQLTSLHDLQEELEESKLAVEQEKKLNKELSSQMVKLNSLIRIGQDAVNAEQATVKKLQEQLAQAKPPTESATANGPASASPVEQPVSKTLERKTAPSHTSQSTTSEKKKSKKKSGSTKK